ncbi:ABC transporter ATP-binding protein [Microbacterium timonense]|uniref:ABC transporter ATP-binding protein n=1 Tax=Microbacterium timonense TaxID=2086576 RepID=UPI001F34AF0B|nr:ABC transporter ATP-binding protein [Microbacterium timonense]
MSSLQAPTGSPLRLLLWQAARQPATLAGGVLFGVLWMLCQVVWPYLLGQAIDAGLAAGVRGVLPWCAALGVVAVLQALFAVLRHRMAVSNWLRSSLGVSRIIGYHSAETGAAIAADSSAGEVASTVANDALRVGEMFDVTARFSGGVVAYVAVGVIAMFTSPALGLFVLLGMPVLVAVLTLFVRPLARRQAAWRREQGALTELAADTVVGLRVLRGIGGEEQFVQRYARRSSDLRGRAVDVARLGSWLDALQILLPGLFVAAVVWFGARLVLAGEISPGELVTFYGYSIFLIVPLRTTVEASQAFARGFVATGRVLDVLRVQRAVRDPEHPERAPQGSAEIVDVASGAVIAPGVFTALVDEDPDAAATVATRLGRFDDRQHTIAPVLWGGVDHTRVPVQEVRRRIVVSDATPHLFTGRLRDGLDVQSVRAPDRAPSPSARRAKIDQALGIAAADDAVQALPAGLEEHVPERASVLSGGQRQRLSLARALLTDAEVLVLIEPTSALDANTEATIAARLHRARAGRTTVLVTASPLLLDRVDVIHVMRNGRVVGSGTHAELLRRDDPVGARYRRIVARTTSDAEPPAGEELDAPWTGSIQTLWTKATETGAIRTVREEPGDD